MRRNPIGRMSLLMPTTKWYYFWESLRLGDRSECQDFKFLSWYSVVHVKFNSISRYLVTPGDPSTPLTSTNHTAQKTTRFRLPTSVNCKSDPNEVSHFCIIQLLPLFRDFQTMTLMMLLMITPEPHYNIDFGVRRKSVLLQNYIEGVIHNKYRQWE